MVAKRAALSPSGEKLPAGWTVGFRVLKTGRRTKYYENSRNGQKFFFKDDITRYADMLDGRKPTKGPISWLSEDDKMHDTGKATNEVPEWLPHGWVMYVKTINSGPNRGKRYKSYQDQSTRHKFYSKLGVLRYLKAAKKKSGAKMKLATVLRTTKVVIETSTEKDLPPGWTKEVRIRKNSGQQKRDSYYTDPETGYVFRSKRSVQHYLETGESSKHGFLLKERLINGNVPASDERKQLIDHINKQQLYADKHIDAGRVKSNVKRSTTPSAVNASRKEMGKKMFPETKQPMVSTAETFQENCTQDNTVNHGAESKESFEEDSLESEKGKSINRTSKNLCRSDHEKRLTLPCRSSRRLAGLEPEQVANSISGTLAIQNVLVTEGAESEEILLEQMVGHEKEKSNKRKSQRSLCNSDNKKGINLPCRCSKRLAGLEPEQKANSITKPVATQHIKKSPEGGLVLAVPSNCLPKQTVVQQCHQILPEQTVEREKEKSNERKSQRSLCNSDNKKGINLPCRCSKRLAGLEPEQQANSITKPVAIQHIKKCPDGGLVLAVPSNCLLKQTVVQQCHQILPEQTVEREKEKSNKRKSQRSLCNSYNKKGINLPCRCSKRLAGLEPGQKANSITKPVAIQHRKKSPEGGVVLAVPSNSLLKQTVVQQCHQILLEQAVEHKKEKSNKRKSQRSLCNSDNKKGLNLPCRFSKRLVGLEPEQKANSITKPVAIQHIKMSPQGRVVLAVPSTSNCLAKEWQKVDVKIDKSECGLNDASGRLLPSSSIKGQVKLYDKPVLRGATTVENVGVSACGSTPATDTINGEILTVNREKHSDDATVINSSRSRHLKELDLPQQSSEIPLGPTPKAKSYQSRSKTPISKASKRNHGKMVGSQNTFVVTLGADVIHNQDFLESARTRQGKRKIQTSSSKFNLVNELSLQRRSSKQIAQLEPEPVGNSNTCTQVPQDGTTSKSGAQESHRPKVESQMGPPNYEYNDGNKASHVAILNNIQTSVPDQGISKEQHEEVKTGKIRNENTTSLLIAPSTEFWSDPCIEFAVKTLTGAIPIENFLNIELVSTAADSGNEKNLHKNQYQKGRMKEPVVHSSEHKRTIVLALESSKQHFGSVGRGKPHNPESKSSHQFKAGFMEYANCVAGFAKTASSYGSSSKRKELTAQLPEKLEIENMKIKEVTPPSFLSFGDCWSDPCLEYALETPAGPIPLPGDLSVLGNFQQQVDASQRDKENHFQLQDISLSQWGSSLVSPEFCFQNDISSYFNAPERQPTPKQLVPFHNPSLLPSANASTAAGNSTNSQASHSKRKKGRERHKSRNAQSRANGKHPSLGS